MSSADLIKVVRIIGYHFLESSGMLLVAAKCLLSIQFIPTKFDWLQVINNLRSQCEFSTFNNIINSFKNISFHLLLQIILMQNT